MSEQAQAAPAAQSEQPSQAAEQSAPEGQAEASSEGGSPESQIQEAVESGELSQAEANKLIKQFKLKVNGKELVKEVNLGDEEYLRNQLQLAEVSKLKMQEAAEIRKQYQKEIERLKSNPWEIMQELGLDPDDLAETRIRQRVEEMKKSPEQVEREKIQKELQLAREEAQRLKQEKEQIEMAKLQAEAAEQLEGEIMSALTAHKSLPQSQYVVKRIADSMLWAMNNGFEDVTAEDVVPLVEKEMKDELNKFMDEMPEELMEKYIGQRNIERMRKRRIAQSKAVASPAEIKPTAQAAKKSLEATQEPPKKIPAKDFFKQLGKK